MITFISLSRVPQSSKQTPSVQHKDHIFSAPEIRQFNTPLSSTPKTPQFNTPLHSNTSPFNTPSFNQKNPAKKLAYIELLFVNFFVLNWGVCWTEGCVELRLFGVELRDVLGWKRVALLCWTDMLNSGGCRTEGDPFKSKTLTVTFVIVNSIIQMRLFTSLITSRDSQLF